VDGVPLEDLHGRYALNVLDVSAVSVVNVPVKFMSQKYAVMGALDTEVSVILNLSPT
jgi:hypothetical protein